MHSLIPSELIQQKIENLYDQPKESFSSEDKNYILSAIEHLDRGEWRVCEKINEEWIVHEWLKKSILLYFQIQNMGVIHAGDLQFFDKIPLKKWMPQNGVRVVPHALARYGSFIEPGSILMPSYVNIGAYLGSGSMLDTWATLGSCAQVGKNVHLSGGVGIGGVLEPIQAKPVIIEDNVFIGSRCIVVEGVYVEEGAVLGAGTTLTASTKIIDTQTGKEYNGHVPKNSVVIPGTRIKSFPHGDFGVPCALIIGQRKESTDKKTSLTQALRDFEVSV